MSAILYGKRSFFDDLPSSPPSSKKIRFSSSSSPVRYSPRTASNIDQLVAIFPHMERQVLEKAIEACGGDLDSTIESLNELCIGSAEKHVGADAVVTGNGEPPLQDDPTTHISDPKNGGEWIELFVQEMMNASNMDDARSRACRALEVLEKSIIGRASAEATESFILNNEYLRGQRDALVHENSILKRAVSIQHERQKDFEDKSQELQHLKQVAAQYQEQLRTLEVNNYALTMHLKQARQNSSSIPGHFNPDVF